MGTTYIGKNGKQYTATEPPIGRGGEGTVYGISGMPDYVLKVFKDGKRTETRHRKLLTMIATQLPPSAMQQITWPIDVVYQNAQFVGYVMPAIKNNEDLNVMYSDKYTCTLSEKITIAKNLCAAINAVHNAGQVCGDLNPKNIGVDPQSARVTLVDTDSYHISEVGSGRVYRCEVGLPEYLPREIQEKMKNGQTLVTAPLPTFTKYSDLFALAVHIFALLMNGCHPFACAVNHKTNINHLAYSQPSVTVPQPIDNILTGYFPFHIVKQGFAIPRYAPEFQSLPANIQKLFVRAFVDGHKDPSKRPDAVEWYVALTDMQQNLSVCKTNKNHMYSSHLKKCVWCELEAKPLPIPPKSTVNVPSNTFTPAPSNSVIPANVYSPPTGGSNIHTPVESDGIMTKGAMFWFLTLITAVGVQALIQMCWGEDIVAGCFGKSYGSGIEHWGTNLGILIGPWGLTILGMIGTLVYNSCWTGNARINGYRWYHYVLSIATSLAFSVLYILLIYFITIAIIVVIAIILIGAVCGIFSGS